MKTPRFFCDAALTAGAVLELPKAVAHHIRVRRLKDGETVVLFDGSGHEFEAHITFDSKGTCTAKLGKAENVERERLGHITLVQALASQDKMDWVIEKAVELGAAAVIAVPSARSLVKLSEDRAKKRMTHWTGIIHAASEQCGRNHLMSLNAAPSLKTALSLLGDSPKLVFSPAATQSLNDPALLAKISSAKQVALFIGPEGGWDSNEVQTIVGQGGICAELGARVMRTETAGLYAIASLSTLLNW
jgi:16S rRNA (uracil1498-N3)-methyltransferase